MKKIFYLLLLVTAFNTACKKASTETPEVVPVVPTTDLPAGAKDGVTFINNGTSAIVTLYAPGKTSVSLIGEFNDWSTTASAMKKTSDGNTWWIQMDNLNPNTEYAYQFYVDGKLKVADPYCEKILDSDNDKYISATVYPNLKAYPTGKTTGIVSVMQANQPTYTWKNTGFVRPEKKQLGCLRAVDTRFYH